MKITTIVVTRSGACHVKTLHTLLRFNIQCLRRAGVQNEISFVNDDPYEKSNAIEKCITTSDRIFFIDFGIHVDDGSMSTIFNTNDNYNVIIFPAVKEGIDWDMFKEKVKAESSEPTNQMGLNFDTEITNKVDTDFYNIKSSSAKSWVMMCKPTLKHIKCRRTGNIKIAPKSLTMFQKFKESGVKVVAYTASKLTLTYPHECISNILNSAGIKAN